MALGITQIFIDLSLQFARSLVCDQLYEYLNGSSLLNACQSGFQSLHSTLTALLEVTNSWSINIDNGLVNGVISIGLKKAFGTIDHDILLRKFLTFVIFL